MMLQTDPRLLLKQSGVKERMSGLELSTLQDDFYKVTKEFISILEGQDKADMISILNAIIMSRKAKISKLAEAVNEDPELKKKMTFEEIEYFNSIVVATIVFKERVMS